MAYTVSKQQAKKVIDELHLIMTSQHFFVDSKGDLKHRRSSKPLPRKVIYLGVFDKKSAPTSIWDAIDSAVASNELTYIK